MEHELGKGTNNEPVKKSNVEAKQEDDKYVVGSSPEIATPSSSSSSSPRRPSLEEIEIAKSPLNDGNTSPGPDPQTPPWSMISVSPLITNHSSIDQASVYPEWSTLSSSPSQMRSPSVQTMGRPSGYDPNRIPTSIFSSKPTNAMEWSVASNESLFSIHMGNNSFSREANWAMFGKSGELPWLEEWNNSQANSSNVPEAKLNELSSFPSSLPPVMEVSAHEESSVRSHKSSAHDKEDSKISNFSPRRSVEEASQKESNVPSSDIKTSPRAEANVSSHRTSSNARLSNESGKSSSSFAFPVLSNEGGKPSSMKVYADKPQLQSHASKAGSPSPQRSSLLSSWFSCFASWPRCC